MFVLLTVKAVIDLGFRVALPVDAVCIQGSYQSFVAPTTLLWWDSDNGFPHPAYAAVRRPGYAVSRCALDNITILRDE